MKNTKTLKALKALEAAQKKYRETEEKAKALHWDEKNYEEARKMCEAAEVQKIEKFYLMDNLALAMLEEYAPAVIEIFNKYSGKPYGEKTKDKIYNEIKNSLNCGAWISNGYNQTIHIYLLDDNGFTGAGQAADIEISLNNNILSDDNKLMETSAKKLTGKYYRAKKTNAAQAAKRYFKEVKKLEKLQEQFRKAADYFNENIQASKMEYLFIRNEIINKY